jgi:exodeoxyribonuclease VII large subunit
MAIATSPLPVLTGLGHEIDRSVADDVAHSALKTPTACAGALIEAVTSFVTAGEARWASIASLAAGRLTGATSALSDRAHRVARRTHAAVERADERLSTRADRLRAAPRRQLRSADHHVAAGAERLSRRVPQVLESDQRALDSRAARLALLDPANLLQRGWSITRAADGELVRSVGAVAAGAIITTQLADGRLTSRIEDS